MQALTVRGVGDVGWEDAPAPTLAQPGAALVRPLAVSTCDFDHLIVSGKAPLPLPLHIGHECVAEVVETGPEVRTVSPGDRVVVPFQVSCGTCAACRRGRTSACAAVPWLSCFGLGELSGGFGGAMSDLLAVPFADAMLVPLPDGVDVRDAAAAACNITDAHRCVAPQLAADPGAPVLVVAGAFDNIALYATGLALGLGAERVDLVHADAETARKAAALGASVIDDLADVTPGSYPITVDAGMDPEALAVALRATAPGGTCTVSTMYPEALTAVPLMEMFANCVTLTTGQPHVRGQLEDVLALLAAPGGSLAQVIDDEVPWDRAPEAFAGGSGKVLLRR